MVEDFLIINDLSSNLFLKNLRFGLFPMMTERTSFIINGIERVIVE